MDRRRKHPQLLRMRLENSPVRLLIDDNVEIHFDGNGFETNRPRHVWIPPPAKTTRKIRPCCLHKHQAPQITMRLQESSSHNLPLTIETSDLENFKGVFPGHGSACPYAYDDRMKRAKDCFNVQRHVIGEAERMVTENDLKRTSLSKTVLLLKDNMEDINRTLRRMEEEGIFAKEKARKSKLDAEMYRENNNNAFRKHHQKGSDSLRNELKKVKDLLEHLKLLNSTAVDKTDDYQANEIKQFKCNGNAFETEKTIEESLAQGNIDEPLRFQLQKQKTTERLYMTPVDEIVVDDENTLNRSDRSTKSVGNGSLKSAKAKHGKNNRLKQISMRGSEKNSSESPKKCVPVEELMMQLADDTRKSKKLLDSVYEQDRVTESMQNEYIQGVEKLYNKQQGMLNALFRTSDSASEGGVSADLQDSMKNNVQNMNTRSSSSSRENEIALNSSHDLNESYKLNKVPELPKRSNKKWLEEKLALTNSKLVKLKKEQEEIARLLAKENSSKTNNGNVNLGASFLENNLFEPTNISSKGRSGSKRDSAYGTKNTVTPSSKEFSNTDESRATANDISHKHKDLKKNENNYRNHLNNNKFISQNISDENLMNESDSGLNFTALSALHECDCPGSCHDIKHYHPEDFTLSSSESIDRNNNISNKDSSRRKSMQKEDESSKHDREGRIKITPTQNFTRPSMDERFLKNDSDSNLNFSALSSLHECDCPGSCHDIRHYKPEEFTLSSSESIDRNNNISNKDSSGRESTQKGENSKSNAEDRIEMTPTKNSTGQSVNDRFSKSDSDSNLNFTALSPLHECDCPGSCHDIMHYHPEDFTLSSSESIDKNPNEDNSKRASTQKEADDSKHGHSPGINPKHLKNTLYDQSKLDGGYVQNLLQVPDKIQKTLTAEIELNSNDEKNIYTQNKEYDIHQADNNVGSPYTNQEKDHAEYQKHGQQVSNPNSSNTAVNKSTVKDEATELLENKETLDRSNDNFPSYDDWVRHGPGLVSTQKQKYKMIHKDNGNKPGTSAKNTELRQSIKDQNNGYLPDYNDWMKHGPGLSSTPRQKQKYKMVDMDNGNTPGTRAKDTERQSIKDQNNGILPDYNDWMKHGPGLSSTPKERYKMVDMDNGNKPGTRANDTELRQSIKDQNNGNLPDYHDWMKHGPGYSSTPKQRHKAEGIYYTNSQEGNPKEISQFPKNMYSYENKNVPLGYSNSNSLSPHLGIQKQYENQSSPYNSQSSVGTKNNTGLSQKYAEESTLKVINSERESPYSSRASILNPRAQHGSQSYSNQYPGKTESDSVSKRKEESAHEASNSQHESPHSSRTSIQRPRTQNGRQSSAYSSQHSVMTENNTVSQQKPSEPVASSSMDESNSPQANIPNHGAHSEIKNLDDSGYRSQQLARTGSNADPMQKNLEESIQEASTSKKEIKKIREKINDLYYDVMS